MGQQRSRGIALAAAFAALSGQAAAACAPDRVELRGDWGAAAFGVDVADDAAERARGLMYVEKMAATRGMLFVYDRPQPTSFWMKNTLIPLDMIFVDETGTVRDVHAEALPLDETPIYGGDNVLAVLEVNGGMAARLGIAPGTELRHPDLPQDEAAWPCQ